MEKLKNLVAEAATININFDYELRPLKSAIGAAESWIAEHKELLQNTGLLKETKKRADETTAEDTSAMEVVPEKGASQLCSLEDLEQLQITANQLPTVFPALK